MPPLVSVVIPTLNEADRIVDCIRSARVDGDEVEVIVADGGSDDHTVDLARRSATVIAAPRGRASQMNAGACAARGEVLLFLHADTTLHPRWLATVRRALRDPRVVGGTFSLRFDHPHPLLRLYGLCSRLPFRLLHYGDQGIWVRRSVFERVGRFRTMPLMEDLEFLCRLRRAGRVAVLPCPVTTSARRFVEHGVVRQQLLNAGLVAAYLLGASPQRLARWYAAAR